MVSLGEYPPTQVAPAVALDFLLEALPHAGSRVGVKLGHFYTVVGVESVMAPENFFYSHSYTMQYGEPFTHTGIRFSYQPTDNLLLDAAAVTGSQFAGWDGVFDHSLENWAFVGGGTWTSDSGELNFYSLVAQHDLTPQLHATLQPDHGWISGDGQTTRWPGPVPFLRSGGGAVARPTRRMVPR